MVIADVKDLEAAEAAVAEIVAGAGSRSSRRRTRASSSGSPTAATYAFVGDMLVVGQAPKRVRAVIDVDRGAESLADQADFVATMEALEPDHLASRTSTSPRSAQAAGLEDQMTRGQHGRSGPGRGAGRPAPERERTVRLRRGSASAAAGFALGGEPSSLVDWMPADTVAEAVVFGLRHDARGGGGRDRCDARRPARSAAPSTPCVRSRPSGSVSTSTRTCCRSSIARSRSR